MKLQDALAQIAGTYAGGYVDNFRSLITHYNHPANGELSHQVLFVDFSFHFCKCMY